MSGTGPNKQLHNNTNPVRAPLAHGDSLMMDLQNLHTKSVSIHVDFHVVDVARSIESDGRIQSFVRPTAPDKILRRHRYIRMSVVRDDDDERGIPRGYVDGRCSGAPTLRCVWLVWVARAQDRATSLSTPKLLSHE